MACVVRLYPVLTAAAGIYTYKTVCEYDPNKVWSGIRRTCMRKRTKQQYEMPVLYHGSVYGPEETTGNITIELKTTRYTDCWLLYCCCNRIHHVIRSSFPGIWWLTARISQRYIAIRTKITSQAGWYLRFEIRNLKTWNLVRILLKIEKRQLWVYMRPIEFGRNFKF